MRFRVLWAPNAEQKFEQLVNSATEPVALAAAARAIDRYLITSPSQFGESRYKSIRLGFVFPLGVQFEVMEDVRTVIVHDVWRIDQK